MANILIIDDDAAYGDLLARLIGREGFRVLGAVNVASGLRLLDKEEVQVVVSDVFLTGRKRSRTYRNHQIKISMH